MMVNSHAATRISPVALVKSLFIHRQLISQMTKREILGRYKGSFMGLAWSLLNPVFMLAVYTFVFSVVFNARWGVDGDEGKAQFAIILFVGMIIHGFFAEVLNRAPALVISNVNFVKKIVFPLEVLPVVIVGAAMFHGAISLCVLLAAFVIFNGYLNWTVVLFPLVVAPFIVMTVGLAWVLASLGVFLRDVGQTVGLLTTVTLFLSPVFYPVSALPESYQVWVMANPLTFAIEQGRQVLIVGRPPDWAGLAMFAVVACAVACLGYAWFQKTRKGFADVL